MHVCVKFDNLCRENWIIRHNSKKDYSTKWSSTRMNE